MMNTYSGEGACKKKKIKMKPCHTEEAVRFAEERDETWLEKQAAITIFTKIHVFARRSLPFLVFKDAQQLRHVNT